MERYVVVLQTVQLIHDFVDSSVLHMLKQGDAHLEVSSIIIKQRSDRMETCLLLKISGLVLYTIAHVTNESDIVCVHPSWDREERVSIPIYSKGCTSWRG